MSETCCPYCGCDFPTTEDGLMVEHIHPRRPDDVCPGSGRRCSAPDRDPALPSPDVDEVERVARAIFDAHEADLDLPERWQWEDASDGVRDFHRRLARASIEALRG